MKEYQKNSEYSPKLDGDINEAIRTKSVAMHKIANLDIVERGQNEMFMKGFQKLSTLEKKDLEAILGLTPEEVKKKWEDRDEAYTIVAMADALGAVNDALLGRAKHNRLLSSIIQSEKSFHNESLTATERAVVMVDDAADLINGQYFDMGWSPSYVARNVLGAMQMKIVDLMGDFFFEELGEDEDPEPRGIGSKKDALISYKRYGGAVSLNDYAMQSSMLSANEILSLIRGASVRTKTWAAYKELFTYKSGDLAYDLQSYYNETVVGNKDKGYKETGNAIYTLNYAANLLKQNAMGIPANEPAKRQKTKAESNLNMSPNQPCIVYYHPNHFDLISKIRRQLNGEDGINAQLEFPFIFVPTYLCPLSGAWEVDDENKKDEWGTIGTVKEYKPKNEVGVHLVIPGYRNQWGVFQNLSFGQDRRASAEKTVFSAFERYIFAKDRRQSARVRIK